jgi:hypothetical protein
MDNNTASALHEAIESLRAPEVFPLEAIEVLRANWSEAAPLLLDALQGDIDLCLEEMPVPESEDDEIDEDAAFPEFDDLAFQACYLFAQHRYRPALPEMLRLLELPFADELLGDFLFEGLPLCLASCSGGDATELRASLADIDADEYARTAAWSAMLSLVAWGELPVDVALDDLLARLGDPDDLDAGFLRGTLAMSVTRLPASEACLAAARAEIASGRADAEVADLADFDRERKTFRPEGWREELLELQGERIEDAAAEIEPWFEEHDDEEDLDDEGYDLDGNWVPPEPIEQLVSEKIGRNDPCPCGSGAKYKKCCGKDA